MGMEKRGRMRIPYKTKVSVKSDGGFIIREAELQDISMNGVFLQTDIYLPDGLKCAVEIIFNGKSSVLSIVAQGKVTRKTDSGIAIEFENNLEWWPVFSMFSGQ